MLECVLLLDLQAVHVGTQTDRAVGSATLEYADDARLSNAGVHLQSE